MANKILGAALAMAIISACGEADIILPGERLDIRPDQAATVNEARPIGLPAQRVNADWTHGNGGPDHQITHPALNATLTQVFVNGIGEGDSLRARITADPVVANGVIYTLDARSLVTATTSSGQTAWTRDVTPATDNASDASGGGLAVGGGQLYVTTGFGEVTAINAATGAELWTQDLDAPSGAPTVFGDLVYIAGRDSTGWALDKTNGRIRWQVTGTPAVAGFGGGSGVAVNSNIAIFPFQSGEVIAAFPQGGLRRWNTFVAGERDGSAAANISDVAGDPVIDGTTVYVGNFSGRISAMDVSNGDRIWTAQEGTTGTVWPVGGSVFLLNDLNELVRLDAADGSVIWRVALPDTVEGRFGSIVGKHAHYGPIVAGGRVIVASSDGVIRQFDPVSGAVAGLTTLEGGASSAPVVAGQTLYVVSKLGNLHAFR
ncbi:PQQ-like beta-propeller repeat protein [Yoonia sp. 208BN28-4]|uniref:PQQ-like beta-propeller repeat protein n=1 Tax=Yoonia sp. 208BN28-4 TaxID=3126505 RepID=UPI0030A7B365